MKNIIACLVSVVATVGAARTSEAAERSSPTTRSSRQAGPASAVRAARPETLPFGRPHPPNSRGGQVERLKLEPQGILRPGLAECYAIRYDEFLEESIRYSDGRIQIAPRYNEKPFLAVLELHRVDVYYLASTPTDRDVGGKRSETYAEAGNKTNDPVLHAVGISDHKAFRSLDEGRRFLETVKAKSYVCPSVAEIPIAPPGRPPPVGGLLPLGADADEPSALLLRQGENIDLDYGKSALRFGYSTSKVSVWQHDGMIDAVAGPQPYSNAVGFDCLRETPMPLRLSFLICAEGLRPERNSSRNQASILFDFAVGSVLPERPRDNDGEASKRFGMSLLEGRKIIEARESRGPQAARNMLPPDLKHLASMRVIVNGDAGEWHRVSVLAGEDQQKVWVDGQPVRVSSANSFRTAPRPQGAGGGTMRPTRSAPQPSPDNQPLEGSKPRPLPAKGGWAIRFSGNCDRILIADVRVMPAEGAR
jgi:hypothetical protein